MSDVQSSSRELLPDGVLGMFHANDPDTSRDAAVRASRGRKKYTIQGAIVTVLTGRRLTPKEIHEAYTRLRRTGGWPDADLYDIRRRLTEVTQAGLVVDTGARRNGERVMSLAVSS